MVTGFVGRGKERDVLGGCAAEWGACEGWNVGWGRVHTDESGRSHLYEKAAFII